MSRDHTYEDFWFKQQYGRSMEQVDGELAREPTTLSPVLQLQRSVGNSRLLQLRAQRATQARMNMAEATSQVEAQAAQDFAAQRQEMAADPQIAIPSGGEALPQEVQKTAEQHLGVSMGDVQVIHGGDAATRPIQAQAFATEESGTPKVVLDSGVDLKSQDGQFTLMHELAHIGQQKKGATSSLEGLGGDEGARTHLENDADHHGQAMVQKLGK